MPCKGFIGTEVVARVLRRGAFAEYDPRCMHPTEELHFGPFGFANWEQKKPINRKHINIFLTVLVGQSSQGRTPTRRRDKPDKMAILLWN